MGRKFFQPCTKHTHNSMVGKICGPFWHMGASLIAFCSPVLCQPTHPSYHANLSHSHQDIICQRFLKYQNQLVIPMSMANGEVCRGVCVCVCVCARA